MQEGTVLCFDFGLARTGVASGNTLTRSAQPVTIIHARTNDERWKAVEALVKEWEPVLLVVGVPRHGDGTDCDLTPRCEPASSAAASACPCAPSTSASRP